MGIAVAPLDGLRLYAWGSVLSRSDDGGTTWTPLTIPTTLCGLVVVPQNANRLYARICAAPGGPHLYRSDDGGTALHAPLLK
jgi:hypothetical protein